MFLIHRYLLMCMVALAHLLLFWMLTRLAGSWFQAAAPAMLLVRLETEKSVKQARVPALSATRSTVGAARSIPSFSPPPKQSRLSSIQKNTENQSTALTENTVSQQEAIESDAQPQPLREKEAKPALNLSLPKNWLRQLQPDVQELARNDPRTNSPQLNWQERFSMRLGTIECIYQERLPDGSSYRAPGYWVTVQQTNNNVTGGKGVVRVCSKLPAR